MKIYYSKHNDGIEGIRVERNDEIVFTNLKGGSVREYVEISCNDKDGKEDIIKLILRCAEYLREPTIRIG